MTGFILQSLQERERALGPFAEPGNTSSKWQHWQMRRDHNNIAWLMLDCRQASVNVLSQAVLEELNDVIHTLTIKPPKALVLRSAKPSSFCVGADIKEFGQLETLAAARKKLDAAHAVANRFAALPFTTVAVVHGHCFGGGLELALCCDYRIGVYGASFGFPEVLLGLHPGLGGTARSTALINPVQAMTMMLTGKTTRDKRAKKLGLINALVPERHVNGAIKAALTGKLKRPQLGLKSRLMQTAPIRRFIAKQMHKQAARKAPPAHYRAPSQLIELWKNYGGNSQKMLAAEVESFAQLLLSDTSKNLVRVFFLQEKMKKLASAATDTAPARHVHVVGAGAMGGDIAGWCALQGLTVSLFDMDPEIIGRAIARTATLCKRKHLSEAGTRAVLDRLIPDLHHQGARHADIIIEAVPEKLAIKRSVYAELEPRMKDGAILATNTSSIPLSKLQKSLQDPSRLVGLHFFNPVAQMQLIEVVRHSKLSEQSYQKALAFSGQIKRLPTPVTGTPGFLVNRVLTPYLLEAIVLLDEGVAAETIDRAAEAFGMPVGPVELADIVGLDICIGVAKMLATGLRAEMPAIPEWLTQKVEAGNLGKKTGQGLYTWERGKAKKQRKTAPGPSDLTDRLLMPMLNMSMSCKRKKVIDDGDLLDGAMIFGTGFAPFRGGPMHYAATRGHADILATLEKLTEQYGPRFTPDPGWKSKKK